MQDPSKPIWVDKKIELTPRKPSIFVATPVHSEVSIHFAQACLEFQKNCMKNGNLVMFQFMKSSLVTQGRNLCVSSFMESKCDYLLFIDSDIDFQSQTIFSMIETNKDLISVPYPLKTLSWDRAWKKIENGTVKNAEQLSKSLYTYPMRLAESHDNITVNKGVIEVTHSPTGCMLIKKEVIEKMIKHYSHLEIIQETIVNGEMITRPHLYNLFDTFYDPETKTFLGEDFAFCKKWRDIGGKCHAYVLDSITHVGEHQYCGRFADELIMTK